MASSFMRTLSQVARTGVLALMMAGAAVAAIASDKRGVGLADRTAADRIQQLKVSWYYTWSPYPMQDPVEAEFVPMVWGGNRIKDHLSQMDRGGPKARVLLALNEPDSVKQGNTSVQDAVAIWPKLSGLTQRIGAPATMNAEGAWSRRFEQLGRAKGLQIDFVAVHIYGPPDAKKFLQRLDAIHAMYGKPIWITEFAVADWEAAGKAVGSNRYSEQDVVRFIRELLPELERRDYVERYAWFGAGKVGSANEAVRPSWLFDSKGALTAVGRAYAGF